MKKNMFDNLGLEKRQFVLKASLLVEKTTSFFLGALMGVENIESSRTLGNKSSALSFNAKVDLLIDIGALESDNRRKFLSFMSIRNQFMHNFSANSYSECVKNIDGLSTFLAKNYPSTKDNMEDRLEESIAALCNDVNRIAVDISESVERKFQKEALLEIYKNSQEAMTGTFDEIEIKFNSYFNEVKDKGGEIKLEDFKDFGTQLKKILYGVWYKKVEPVLKQIEEVDKTSTENDSVD